MNIFREGWRFWNWGKHLAGESSTSTPSLAVANEAKSCGSVNLLDHENTRDEEPKEEELREEQRREKERRKQMVRNLTQIYCNIPKGKVTVEPRLHSILRLRTEVLNLGDDGDYANGPPDPNFFLPLPLEKVQDHTVDMEDPCTRLAYQRHKERTFPPSDSLTGSRAQFLSYGIDCEFCEFARKGIEAASLRCASMWLESGGVLDYWFWKDMFPAGRKFHFTSGWKVKRDLLPHVTLNIRHDVNAEEDLLRGEVLPMIGVMLTHLHKKEFKQHIVIPVMILSFMSDLRGRVLQGYFDGREVIIRKTKLYDFSTKENLEAGTELFLQWMASTPYGDTKNFKLRDFAPLTDQEEEILDCEDPS